MRAVGSSDTALPALDKTISMMKGPIGLGLFLAALGVFGYLVAGHLGIDLVLCSVAAGAIGIAVNDWKLFRYWIRKKWLKVEVPKTPRYLCERDPKSSAEWKFVTSGTLWLKWKAARPFLYTSRCEYARALVMTMIEACEEMLAEGVILPDGLLEALHRQLTRPPPPHRPFGYGPTSVGLSLLRR